MDDIRGLDYVVSLGLSAAALLIRTLYSVRAHPVMDVDNERYTYLAQSFLSGNFKAAVHYHYPPLAPILTALFSPLFNNLEQTSLAVAIFANSLVILPVYFLALRLSNRRAAVLAACFFAFRCFDLAAYYQAEQVVMLLVWVSILAGFSALETRKPARFFIAGAGFGLAFLAKPEAWAYFLLFLCLASATAAYGIFKSKSKHRSLGSLAALLAGYFLLAAPYLFSYYRDSGKFSFNPKARTLFILHNFYAPRFGQYQILQDEKGYYTLAQRVYMEGDKTPIQGSIPRLLWKNRANFPGIYLHRMKSSFRHILAGFFLQKTAPFVWIFLLPLGLWPARGPEWRKEVYLHAFALVPILLVPLFSSEYTRFYFSLLPWFAIVSGRGAERFLAGMLKIMVGNQIQRQKIAQWPVPLIGAALLLLAVLQIVQAHPDRAYWSEIEFRKSVAQKLKSMLQPGCNFMAELETESFWYLAGLAPARQVVLPMAELPEIISYAEQTRSRFLVFHPSQMQAQGRYKNLEPLLNSGFEYPGLKLLFRGQSPAGNIYVIFQIESVKCADQAIH